VVHCAPGNVRRRRLFEDNVVTKTKAVSSSKKSTKRTPARSSKVVVRNKPLSTLTGEALDGYFRKLNGHKPGDLYNLVLGEVERPLFQAVLEYTKGNQSEAAEILGINRGTLRKKLRSYNLWT
jgi:Fis family transcriptional regulator, factor for inversion stimulation protein